MRVANLSQTYLFSSLQMWTRTYGAENFNHSKSATILMCLTDLIEIRDA